MRRRSSTAAGTRCCRDGAPHSARIVSPRDRHLRAHAALQAVREQPAPQLRALLRLALWELDAARPRGSKPNRRVRWRRWMTPDSGIGDDRVLPTPFHDTPDVAGAARRGLRYMTISGEPIFDAGGAFARLSRHRPRATVQKRARSCWARARVAGLLAAAELLERAHLGRRTSCGWRTGLRSLLPARRGGAAAALPRTA